MASCPIRGSFFPQILFTVRNPSAASGIACWRNDRLVRISARLNMFCNLLAFRNATDEQCNFVSIDWSCSDGTYTCQNPFEYCQIVKKVNWIGRQVGDFLVRMHNLLHLDGATTWCYGHSLGSHICGGAGRRFFASLRTKIFSIIGT